MRVAEQYPIGCCLLSLPCCSRTAPTANPEASTSSLNGLSSLGCFSTGSAVTLCHRSLNACCSAVPQVHSMSFLMKCAIAESYTHIGQAQIDKSEVKNRASEEHNRRDDDHTGTPVRERELEYQGDTWVLLIHNSVGIYYCI